MASIMQAAGSLHPTAARRGPAGGAAMSGKVPAGAGSRPPARRLPALAALALAPLALSWAPARDAPEAPPPPRTLFDERLAELRRASVSWMNRPGPRRRVVDQVCLVPDVATFLRAVAAWDSEHYFPVLIDDPETNLRFLRAFRPSRVVRMPEAGPAVADEKLWARAVEAVGDSWSSGARPRLPGELVPEALGPTPPGVVACYPRSPSLAGAVALAAGRFQPLVRWEPDRPRGVELSLEEADRMMADLEARVAVVAPKFDRLGDDCDFVTLAGEWPDRYRIPEGQKKGSAALDDLLARRRDDIRRWGYVGRLIGGPAESAYRAMCSLFLQPESAILVNGYQDEGEPWAGYQMRDAASRLVKELRTFHRSGPEEAGLVGWHRAFDPINRHGLVLINSSGGENNFNLPGGPGRTADVPMSVPAAVLMIHSFSAARPSDSRTLAGRWLDNGAFLYFGSMNEPYLNAFRTPTLVANLLADGLPASAAVRKLVAEDGFGTPWRLVYLGDPLYRLDPKAAGAPRLGGWGPTSGWPAYDEPPPPGVGASDEERLAWGLRAAIVQAARLEGGRARSDWQAVILAIRRDRLPEATRPVYDALLADVVTFARPGVPWRPRVEAIPAGERAGVLARSLEAREALGVDRGVSVRRR